MIQGILRPTKLITRMARWMRRFMPKKMFSMIRMRMLGFKILISMLNEMRKIQDAGEDAEEYFVDATWT